MMSRTTNYSDGQRFRPQLDRQVVNRPSKRAVRRAARARRLQEVRLAW